MPIRTGYMLAMGQRKFKTIRRYHQPGDCHELTFSCASRLPLLADDESNLLLAESIDGALSTFELHLSAYVFMPEHVHLPVWPANARFPDISGFLKKLKLSCSSKIKRRLTRLNSPWLARLTRRERPGVSTFRFWQEGPGYDRNLDHAKAVLASIDYIHNNPVKRGLCELPQQRRWSSFRHYLADPQWKASPIPRVTALPAEFLTGAS